MRFLRHLWNNVPRRTVAAATLAGAMAASPAWAQRFPNDPVEELRQALRNTKREAGAREKAMTQRLEALRTLGDLRRALQLQEWSDTDLEEKVAEIDRAQREAVARRFEQGIRAALQDKDATVRRAAAGMLAEIGTTIKAVKTRSGLTRGFGPDLAALIKKGDESVVLEAAARALGAINPDPEVAVPALSMLLNHNAVSTRAAAADALVMLVRNATANSSRTSERGAIGTVGVEVTFAEAVAAARLATPAAARAVADANPIVRRLGAQAMGSTAGTVTRFVPDPRAGDDLAVTEESRKQAEEDRALLAPLLTVLREQAPVLVRAVGDPDSQVRRTARRVVEDLAIARHRLQRRAAGGAVEDPLQEALRGLVPALAAGTADPDVQARRAAIDALEPLGNDAAGAAPALVLALGDPDRFVRWSASRVLGKIAPAEAGAAVPALIRLLGDNDLDLRRGAAAALEKYGPEAKAAVPVLVDTLNATDVEMRVAAIHTLEGIGNEARPAIPALAAALGDPDARVRQAAAEALGRFGSSASAVIAPLRRALDDENADVRRAVSDALLSILPPARK